MNDIKVIDITGELRDGMWNYEPPFPEYRIKPLPEVPWVTTKVYCEIFDGLHSQTGTYLETPAHFYGPEKSYNLIDVPVNKLFNIPCVLIMLKGLDVVTAEKKRPAITSEMLKAALNGRAVPEGCAVIIGCSWDKYWFEKEYLDDSPYFTLDAMEWIVSKKPSLLATDFPRWENLDNLQGIFPVFYAADILMLAPVANLDEVGEDNGTLKLTVLPIKASSTSCAPCRAVISKE